MILTTARSLSAQTSDYSFSGDYISHTVENNVLHIVFEGGQLNLRYFSNIGFNIQYHNNQSFETTHPASNRFELQTFQITNQDDRIRINVFDEQVIIQKKPLRLRFGHVNGNNYLMESLGAGWFNDKPIHVLEKDKHHYLHATYVEQSPTKAIFGISQQSNWAIFYENYMENRIELGSESIQHWGFSAEGGELKFILITGKNPSEIVRKYRLYAGKSILPPKWALGYHSFIDGDASSQDIINYSLYLRKKSIPIDVIHLGSSYLANHIPFTWDSTKVPDPKVLANELQQKGFRLVIPIHTTFPNRPDFNFIKDGLSSGVFYNSLNSISTLGIRYTPSVLKINPNHSETYPWLKAQISQKLKDNVAGFSISESTLSADQASILDRLYGRSLATQSNPSLTRASVTSLIYDAAKDIPNSKRVLIHSNNWSADSNRKFHYFDSGALKDDVTLMESLTKSIDFGLLGYPGSMIKIDPKVDANHSTLHAPMASSAFFPGVSWMGDYKRTIPDSTQGSNDLSAILPQYAALRYHFNPMIFTAWWQHTQEGSPILRPSWWYGLDHIEQLTDHVFIGDHLWYIPLMQAHEIDVQKDLPKGVWYQYFTKFPVAKNIQMVASKKDGSILEPHYHTMALFARAGSVIPTREMSDYFRANKSNEIVLNVFAGGSATSYLYEDDDSYELDQNSSRMLEFKTENHSKGFRIRATKVGDFNQSTARFSYLIHGLVRKPDRITVNGRNIVYFYEPTTNTIIFKISAGETDIHIFFP